MTGRSEPMEGHEARAFWKGWITNAIVLRWRRTAISAHCWSRVEARCGERVMQGLVNRGERRVVFILDTNEF